MAKMRGFLHSKPKIDDAEWALAQSRTAERLAGLFSDAALDGTEETVPTVVEPALAGPVNETADTAGPVDAAPAASRPPIVIGDAGPDIEDRAEPATAEVATAEPATEVATAELVGVMADQGDRFDDNGWQLPTPSPADRPTGLPKPARATKPPASGKPASAASAAGSTARAAGVTARTAGGVPAAGPTAEATGTTPPRPPRASTKAGHGAPAKPPARAAKARPKRRSVVRPAPAAVAHCPYCAVVLDPAPMASRRCERCRQRIMVKRVDGHPVFLTEAAVAIFNAERRRVASSARLTRERARWLGLAAAAGAPERRHAQLAAGRLSEDNVAASRALYLAAVDRAFRAARREKAWDAAARIRREQAGVLDRAAGSHRPPTADVVALYREGVAAELRGIAEISRDAELVAASCCDACRADDRRIFRISAELRQPRLPHAGCPRGLCRCHWDLAARDRTAMRRYLRRRPGAEAVATGSAAATAEAAGTDKVTAPA